MSYDGSVVDDFFKAERALFICEHAGTDAQKREAISHFAFVCSELSDDDKAEIERMRREGR